MVDVHKYDYFHSSAVVGIGAVPEKLNPLIKPLMESIKRETNSEILAIVANKLVNGNE